MHTSLPTHIDSSTRTTSASVQPDHYYSMDGMHKPTCIDDLTQLDISGYEREKYRIRDLEIGNRRSLQKRVSYPLVDKVSFDHDSGHISNTSFQIKPSGFRGSGLKAEDFDDLVAMGTVWSPTNNSIPNNTKDSILAGSISGKSASVGPQITNGSKLTSSQRKFSNPQLKLSNNSNASGSCNTMFGMQLNVSSNKELPKYQDPLVGAPASFQQRLMELTSLEADTVRWERAKKVKKKSRQDRD